MEGRGNKTRPIFFRNKDAFGKRTLLFLKKKHQPFYSYADVFKRLDNLALQAVNFAFLCVGGLG